MLEFGNLIREARERTHKSALHVALAADITQSMLSDFERGKKANPPSPEVMSALSTELGIPEIEMLRAIGYLADEHSLPSAIDILEPVEQEVMTVLAQLPSDRKSELLNFAGYLLRNVPTTRMSLPHGSEPSVDIEAVTADGRKRKAG